MKHQTVIVIVGPTGSGKTSLAINLAKHYNCEIISADSRQVYKEMSIGTAVPPKKELQEVTHHMIHNKSILNPPFSAADYAQETNTIIKNLFNQYDKIILIGGTGLYVDAVLNGFEEIPDIDPSIRKELNKKLREDGLAPLQKQLSQIDPSHFNSIDIKNPRRVIRALEVSIGTGKPYSSFLRKKKDKKNPFNTIKIGLSMERNTLYKRINNRVDSMIQSGLLKEAKSLTAYQNHPALQTIGYQEFFAHFDGFIDLEDTIKKIKQNTRRYAKRQITWFKRDPEINWFDADADLTNFVDLIDSKIT